MICSGCGGALTTSEDPNHRHYCQACFAREEEHRQAVDRAKLRAHRILRAMRDRPVLLDVMNALMRPRTKEDAVNYLLCTMPEAERAKMRVVPRDKLILYHHGFGERIRNRFRLHSETDLVKDCSQGRENEDADEASMAIIEALWEAMQDSDLPEPPAG